jgi:hypothetical protein
MNATTVWMNRAGWVLSAVVVLFMLRDVSYDLPPTQWAIDANLGLGIPADLPLWIGVTGLVCTLLYALPQTAVLGAILLSGFIGGAVMTHLRVHGSMHDVAENVLISVVAWAGLWLRDQRLRAILPWRQ